MFKKIGLSAAALLATVALAKPPAAMAADRDDFHHGDRDNRRHVQEYREVRDYRDYRNDRNGHDQRRVEWREPERRAFQGCDRDCDWR